MRIVVTRNANEFGSQAWTFLAQCLERNVLATVLLHVRSGAFSTDESTFAYALDDGGAIAAAALRVGPWPMLATGFAADGTATELAERWLAIDPEVDAVNAEPATARAVAEAIATRTGGRARLETQQAIHALTAVTEPPYHTDGYFRAAGSIDREQLITWERDFAAETGIGSSQQAERMVDRRLASGRQFVWDNHGPACTAGINAPIAGTARIGPVYTPPELRGRGYATALVAALSRHTLASGADRCMLVTDLANPTSNKIYALIGYVRCGEMEEHVIER
jgi:RimJ/RimL family protein N-acetyltransferase